MAVDARRLPNKRGGYAAEFLDRFGRPGLDASPERLGARNTRLHELFVAQAFGDQDVRHRVEQRNIGPRPVGDDDVGLLRKFARNGDLTTMSFTSRIRAARLKIEAATGKLRLGLTPTTNATSAFSIWVYAAVAAPEPSWSMSATTELEWHSRAQWSTEFVPKPVRISFWKR